MPKLKFSTCKESNSWLDSELFKEAINTFLQDVYEEKVRLIKQRLVELTGIELDYEAEARRRFKKFALVIDEENNAEHYYYDNGTEEGLLLISFYKVEPEPFNIHSPRTHFELKLNYK